MIFVRVGPYPPVCEVAQARKDEKPHGRPKKKPCEMTKSTLRGGNGRTEFQGQGICLQPSSSCALPSLVAHEDKGIGPVAFNGNLVIHGDNLHALKSLLPLYAGKVGCVFIDPPYNTGNEGWCYNDNVNAPMIKEWLDSNPVGIEDGLRHDKWCAMMWPRLRLLHELLAEHGSLWVTLDDNEVHRARERLDEISEKTAPLGKLRGKRERLGRTGLFYRREHSTALPLAVWGRADGRPAER